MILKKFVDALFKRKKEKDNKPDRVKMVVLVHVLYKLGAFTYKFLHSLSNRTKE